MGQTGVDSRKQNKSFETSTGCLDKTLVLAIGVYLVNAVDFKKSFADVFL